MALPITPDLLEAAYDFLCATPPFKSWRMPPGDEVKFGVMRKADTRGDHEKQRNGQHMIRVSSTNTGCTDALLRVMAHEMVHVICTRERAMHGAAFQKRARAVCRYHGFDPLLF